MLEGVAILQHRVVAAELQVDVGVSEQSVLVGIGAGIGLILSGIMAPLMSSLLYGVEPLDPEVFIAVPAILMVVVLLASYIPAWRAARVNPIVALRRES